MSTATVNALTDANANPKQRNVAFGKCFNSLDNISTSITKERRMISKIKSSTVPTSLNPSSFDWQLTSPKVYRHQLFLCKSPHNTELQNREKEQQRFDNNEYEIVQQNLIQTPKLKLAERVNLRGVSVPNLGLFQLIFFSFF